MRKVLAVVWLLMFGTAAWAEDVPAILARMDKAAPGFHAMSADIQMLTWTKVIDDKIVEDGTLKMQRLKDGAVRAVIDFSGQKDSAREIGFLGKVIRIYYPGLNVYQDYEVGKNSDVLNQFLLLGFGSSGHDLAQNYDITPEGTEKVAGVQTTKLLLIPKDPKVKERLARIEMWIPEGQASPVQQQFYEPDPPGNYRKVTYSNMKVNPSIKGNLEMKMQSGAQKRTS
jgi:outer membrane lipoprotein-sorting protein